jgi:hypothetical protein
MATQTIPLLISVPYPCPNQLNDYHEYNYLDCSHDSHCTQQRDLSSVIELPGQLRRAIHHHHLKFELVVEVVEYYPSKVPCIFSSSFTNFFLQFPRRFLQNPCIFAILPVRSIGNFTQN